MCSTDADRLDAAQRAELLALARASIAHGLAAGQPLAVDPSAYSAPLSEPGAAFVTLHLNGQLRGCIGSLEAYRPLIQDVADNAYAAAFRDPRFAPVSGAEAAAIALSVSVLTPAVAMDFSDEADLVAQLRPGIDGLVLRDGRHRGTFLPAVWEQLPRPVDFLRQLKRKAGLPADHWSPSIQVSRYRTESFS